MTLAQEINSSEVCTNWAPRSGSRQLNECSQSHPQVHYVFDECPFCTLKVNYNAANESLKTYAQLTECPAHRVKLFFAGPKCPGCTTRGYLEAENKHLSDELNKVGYPTPDSVGHGPMFPWEFM